MSAMRRSTVYDFSSLRLHPDGTRVQPTTRAGRRARRDARGNWVATDAAGPSTVKKRRQRGTPKMDDDGEEIDGLIVMDDEDYTPPPTKRTSSTDRRTAKRAHFLDDFTFLAPPEAPVSDAQLPSSDLLKCIHHFASTYYAERGQLFDASREARREKKLRRLARLGIASNADTSIHDPALSDSDSSGEEDSRGEPSISGERVPDAGARVLRTDMYRMMDGGALMAIGMLLQEHVAQLLGPQVEATKSTESAIVTGDNANLGDMDPEAIG